MPKWEIRTQSPQHLDGLRDQYKNQVPTVQVQPVTIFQYDATFIRQALTQCGLIFSFMPEDRPDNPGILIGHSDSRFIEPPSFF